MNGYWDALARAALDLPSDADPRPGSRFEVEPVLAGERLDGIEEAADNLETSRGKVESKSAVPAEALAQAPVAATATTRVHTRPSEAMPALPREPSPIEPAPAAGTRAEGARHDAEATPASQPIATERIERLEIHRKETTHTVREVPGLPAPESGEDEPRHWTREPGPGAHGDAQRHPLTVAAVPREVIKTQLVSRAEPAAQGPAERGRDERDVTAELAPLVIEIDRVDIRIEHDRPIPAAPVQPGRQVGAGGVPSLSDYLARRSEARA